MNSASALESSIHPVLSCLMMMGRLCTWLACCLGFSLQAQQTPFLDPLYGTVVTSNIQYGTGSVGNPATGQIPLHLDLYRPTGAGLPATLPGFVVIHGGGFTGGTKSDVAIVELCQAYARRGYVTVSIRYRLAGDNPTLEAGPMPGTTAQERAMNAASQDAAKAVRWLRANAASYGVDTNRIAIGGGSAGAITSLFTGYQEAGTIGANADVSVILDLWGGMYGNEALVDANDPPVFIVHGTADNVVETFHSQNLVTRLNAVGLDYRYYPIQGAGHGPWSAFFNGVVGGKTLDRLCAEFFFKKLRLVEIHPGAAAAPFVQVNTPVSSVKVSIPTAPLFLYQLFSSTDFTSWSPVHANSIAGTGTPLEITHSPDGDRAFYRWVISPGF